MEKGVNEAQASSLSWRDACHAVGQRICHHFNLASLVRGYGRLREGIRPFGGHLHDRVRERCMSSIHVLVHLLVLYHRSRFFLLMFLNTYL